MFHVFFFSFQLIFIYFDLELVIKSKEIFLIFLDKKTKQKVFLSLLIFIRVVEMN